MEAWNGESEFRWIRIEFSSKEQSNAFMYSNRIAGYMDFLRSRLLPYIESFIASLNGENGAKSSVEQGETAIRVVINCNGRRHV